MFKRLPKDVAGRTFIDLGSGDGVTVIAAAKKGMTAVGVELNPWLVAISKWSAWRQGVSKQTTFICGNLFAADVSKSDVIMVFGVKPLMPRLSDKLREEAPRPSLIVSHKFELPRDEWRVLGEEDSLLFYHNPASWGRGLDGDAQLQRADGRPFVRGSHSGVDSAAGDAEGGEEPSDFESDWDWQLKW